MPTPATATPPAKVATRGDLVVGLAEADPPTAFVAELGDPAREAGKSITDPLLAAAGQAPPRVPRVRIGGTEVATQSMRATGLGPAGPRAETVDGSGMMRIGGEALTSQGDGSALGGTRMVIDGGKQQALSLGGARQAIEPEAAGDTIAAMRKQIPVRTEFGEPTAAQRMLSRCSPARRRDLVPSELAVLVGDPIDVACGAVVTTAIELDLASPPLRLQRRYASNRSDRVGGFGFGWTHDFEQALWLEPGRVVLREADGRELEFDTMGLPGQVARTGDILHDTTGRLTLRCMGRLHWELRGRTGELRCIRHFRPEAGESAAGRDRGMSRLARIVPVDRGPLVGLVELAYDDAARVHEIRSAGRPVVTLEYDAAGRIESLWTPQGGRLQRHARFVYSPEGDLVNAFDAAGSVRSYEYVGHLLVAETNRDGGTFFYGYDGHGKAARCVRSWGTGGVLDRALTYDGGHTQVTDSLGNVSEFQSDATGVVTQVTDAHGDRTRYRHDDHLRLVERVAPDGTRTLDTYDDRDNLVKRRLPSGAVWRMAYDAADRVVQAWDPCGARWSFGWDSVGGLVRVEDPLGHTSRFEYDRGRLAAVVDPLGGRATFELDEVGNVSAITATTGGTTRFEYDRWGRLAAVRGPSGTRLGCMHDAQGRIVGHHDDAGAVRLLRSAEGELIGIDAPRDRWGIARDPFGTVLAVHGPATALGYDHDSEGRLVAVRRDGQPHLALLRDARGSVTAFTKHGGAPSLVHHAARSRRVERIVDPQHALHLGWDADGRLVTLERIVDGVTSRSAFVYRTDGLLIGASDERSRCLIDRDARGAVVRQRTVVGAREVVVDTAALDFLGRRHGVDVDPGLRVSYLRSPSGDVERIAIVDEQIWDIEITTTEDRRIEWLRTEFGALELRFDDWGALQSVVVTPRDGHAALWQPGRAISPRRSPPTRRDALGRPLADARGEAAVMDEDRSLRGDDAWWLHHPDRDLPIARVAAGRLDLVLPDATHVPLDAADARAQRWFEDGFPLAGLASLRPAALGPEALLRRWFAPRVWMPEPRPSGGTHPWLPDAWSAEPSEVPAIDGRLDAPRLLAIFAADFPTTGLRPTPPETRNQP